MGRSQWAGEVEKMRRSYGAQLDDGEAQLVVIYLAAAYGDAMTVAAAQLAAAPKPAEPSTRLDAKALLDKNGCLGCHSLKQKVVGPAYSDVAAKYRSDPAAKAKVSASIQQGGSGRWGTVPMPPFAGLSAAEARALADFVLAQ